MIELFQVALEVQDFCEANHWGYCFIGGVALQRWGEPRVTQDVDLTLVTGFGNEKSFIEPFLEKYSARIDDAEKFALDNRVLLLVSETGIGIDIALGGLPFEELAVEHATRFEFLPEVKLKTCSAEDLVIFKAFASRFRDWADLEGILARNGSKLDWGYIQDHLQPLLDLKETPQIMDQLQELRQRFEC